MFAWIKGVFRYKKREDALLEALAWMACQYLERERGNGKIGLYHSFMSAGELACDALGDHGLITVDAAGGEWTEKGVKFLNDH